MDAPEKIKFRGATYVLVTAKDKDDKDDKKRGKKAKGEDVFSNVRLHGDGISFYINILLRAKDAESVPFARRARGIPESVELTADQLEEALAAKKAGELWHIYAADVGWFWRGENKTTAKIEDVQKVLDMVAKYGERVRNPIIYAVVSNKIIGKW